MVILIKKILIFASFFFLFNLSHIDSNSDKRLIYDNSDIYNKEYHTIYFVSSTTFELRNIFNILDIEVLSYMIDGKKYYARNIDEVERQFLSNKNFEEKIYYYDKSINVDSVNVICSINEIMKLNNMVDIY